MTRFAWMGALAGVLSVLATAGCGPCRMPPLGTAECTCVAGWTPAVHVQAHVLETHDYWDGDKKVSVPASDIPGHTTWVMLCKEPTTPPSVEETIR